MIRCAIPCLLLVITALLNGCMTSASSSAPSERPATVSTRPNSGREDFSPQQWLNNPYQYLDQTIRFETESDWASGTTSGLIILSTGEITLPSTSTAYPRVGTWSSPEITTDFPFSQLLPSWNLKVKGSAGLSVFVRSRDALSGQWSPWLYLGCWGDRDPAVDSPREFPGGEIDVDYLKLASAADAYQIQARLESFSLEPSEKPVLEKLVAITSGRPADGVDPALIHPSPEPPANWARDLPVPFRAQGIEHKTIRGRICSPTSTSMVMEYFGVSFPTPVNALAIYDREAGIFGNWHRAVAYASTFGLEGELVRFRDWNQVKTTIASGQPIICSIRFRRDEFPSNVNRSSNGHLIVLRGLTPEGDAIVNDPASRERGNGVIYKADELARAWLGRGGVGYVIKRPE